jgi:hypothetical protein
MFFNYIGNNVENNVGNRASVGTVKMIFNPESGYRLNDMQ